MEILVIMGAPYSGKGTQCEVLKEILGFKHISTGDRIRLEKQQQTEIGKTMKAYEEKGKLVPDAIMENLIRIIIDENIHEKGVILDGYPRTKNQVDTLLQLFQEKGEKISKVINIEVPKEELLARAKKRAETSDRKDDKDSKTHYSRIEVFETETKPAIEYMKSLLSVVSIDGLGSIEEITSKIKKEVNHSFS